MIFIEEGNDIFSKAKRSFLFNIIEISMPLFNRLIAASRVSSIKKKKSFNNFSINYFPKKQAF